MPHRPLSKQPKRSMTKVQVRHPSRKEIEKSATSKGYHQQLVEAEETGDIRSALKVATLIVQTPNSSILALDEAFEVLISGGETDLACAALRLALARDKVSVDAAYRFLAFFGTTGEIEHLNSAIIILEQYKTIKEHENQLVYALGRLDEYYLALNDGKESENVIHRLEAVDSAGIVTSIQKAAHFLVADQMEQCAAHIQQAWAYFIDKDAIIEIEEDDGIDFNVSINDFVPEQPFLLSMTRCLTALEDYPRAAAICELALAQSEDDAVLLHEMAWIMNLQEDYEESKQYLEKALFIYEEQGAVDMVQDIQQKLEEFK